MGNLPNWRTREARVMHIFMRIYIYIYKRRTRHYADYNAWHDSRRTDEPPAPCQTSALPFNCRICFNSVATTTKIKRASDRASERPIGRATRVPSHAPSPQCGVMFRAHNAGSCSEPTKTHESSSQCGIMFRAMFRAPQRARLTASLLLVGSLACARLIFIFLKLYKTQNYKIIRC